MSDLLDDLHDHDPVDHNILNMSEEEQRAFSGEKWIAMFFLTLVSVIFGILPYILFSYFRRVIRSDSKVCKLSLAALSSISGGFLLATTMLHILPEVREKAEAQKSSRVGQLWGFLGSNVPVAELLMLYGFCLIYGIEEIAQFLLKCKCSCSNQRRKVHHDHNHSHPRQGFGGLGMKPGLDCGDSGFGIGEKYLGVENGIVLKECQHTELIKTQMDQCDSGVTISISSDSSDSQASSSCSPTNIHGSIRTLNTLEMTMQVQSPLGALRSLVSLLALSFHAIMEGIAVGVQVSLYT
jgi:zinc transporter ZupT